MPAQFFESKATNALNAPLSGLLTPPSTPQYEVPNDLAVKCSDSAVLLSNTSSQESLRTTSSRLEPSWDPMWSHPDVHAVYGRDQYADLREGVDASGRLVAIGLIVGGFKELALHYHEGSGWLIYQPLSFTMFGASRTDAPWGGSNCSSITCHGWFSAKHFATPDSIQVASMWSERQGKHIDCCAGSSAKSGIKEFVFELDGQMFYLSRDPKSGWHLLETPPPAYVAHLHARPGVRARPRTVFAVLFVMIHEIFFRVRDCPSDYPEVNNLANAIVDAVSPSSYYSLFSLLPTLASDLFYLRMEDSASLPRWQRILRYFIRRANAVAVYEE
ncbi:hypothetical protein FRB99_008124, partial [Tulasnella sp. 403]